MSESDIRLDDQKGDEVVLLCAKCRSKTLAWGLPRAQLLQLAPLIPCSKCATTIVKTRGVHTKIEGGLPRFKDALESKHFFPKEKKEEDGE